VCLSVIVKPRKMRWPRPPRGCRGIGRKKLVPLSSTVKQTPSIHGNVGDQCPKDTALHPRRREPSATTLREPPSLVLRDCLIFSRVKRFFSVPKIQTGSGGHYVSYSVCTGGYFSGVKRPRFEADHSVPSNTKIQNEWS
jgi:hypothetical protein